MHHKKQVIIRIKRITLFVLIVIFSAKGYEPSILAYQHEGVLSDFPPEGASSTHPLLFVLNIDTLTKAYRF